MTTRLVAALWLVVGIAVWNGFFDLYISRGARLYLQLQAEAELAHAPQPSMAEVMDPIKRDGVIAASIWAGAIVAAGWGTIVVARRKPHSAGIGNLKSEIGN